MKFDAKMAREIADCWNEIDIAWDLIFPKIFTYAVNGLYKYEIAQYENDHFMRYKVVCNCKGNLEALGFKVEIDEDMKIATISW